MENNIGDPELINSLNDITEKLTQGVKLMAKYGRELAKSELSYKVALAKEVLRMREQDTPVTLIQLRIYGSGEVANMRFQRDTAQVMYDTAKENINVLKLRARLLEAQIDREYRG